MGLSSQFSKDAIIRGDDGSVGTFGVGSPAVGAKKEGGVGPESVKQLIEVGAIQVLDKIFIPIGKIGDVFFESVRDRRWRRDSNADCGSNEKRLGATGDIDGDTITW
jgi:hypothetical protein